MDIPVTLQTSKKQWKYSHSKDQENCVFSIAQENNVTETIYLQYIEQNIEAYLIMEQFCIQTGMARSHFVD